MTQCQTCGARSQTYLCPDCSDRLESMLSEIPELLDELDARIQQLDRITVGTIRRQRRPAEMAPIDVAALDESRKVRDTLKHWVTTVAERHNGRRPPGLGTVATPDLARWLARNIQHVQNLHCEGKKCRRCAGDLYQEIHHLVGDAGVQNGQRGELVTAVRPVERHFAGLCNTIRGYDNHGKPIECGRALYTESDARTVTCSACGFDIDVKRNLTRTFVEHDLLTEQKLLETLDQLDEHISARQLDKWIDGGQLPIAGYLHHGEVVPEKKRHKDPRVFSLSRVRHLRWQQQEAKTR